MSKPGSIVRQVTALTNAALLIGTLAGGSRALGQEDKENDPYQRYEKAAPGSVEQAQAGIDILNDLGRDDVLTPLEVAKTLMAIVVALDPDPERPHPTFLEVWRDAGDAVKEFKTAAEREGATEEDIATYEQYKEYLGNMQATIDRDPRVLDQPYEVVYADIFLPDLGITLPDRNVRVGGYNWEVPLKILEVGGHIPKGSTKEVLEALKGGERER